MGKGGKGTQNKRQIFTSKIHTTYLLVLETCYHNIYNEVPLGHLYKLIFSFLNLISIIDKIAVFILF